MKIYLFRAEAVNLNHTVYDTSDISTIRGGGFYLLDRVNSLANNSAFSPHKISEGASAAVFKIPTESPQETRRQMLDFLYAAGSQSEALKAMMFIVEYLENTGKFPQDSAGLMGKIRTAQMQTASIRLSPEILAPGYQEDEKRMRFDVLNRVLPAHNRDPKGNVSPFTFQRRRQGITLRKNIYHQLLAESFPEIKDYSFADELEKLSVDSRQGNLDGKIAFIYIDGNKFGTLQKDFAEDQLQKYDAKLQNFKIEFLRQLIMLAKDYPSFLTADHQVRLETLLWGGDEIKMIVPAWLGWKAALMFYELSKAQNMTMDEKDLTYAMGLVFAHHKNPVKNLSKIASDLADTIKSVLKDQAAFQRSDGDRMGCVVLESLETLPQGYREFAKTYYKSCVAGVSMTLSEMYGLRELAGQMDRAGFPRTKLYHVAAAWRSENAEDYARKLQQGLAACETGPNELAAIIGNIEILTQTEFIDGQVSKKLPADGHRWIQLSELWDYLTWKER